jgi:hypothetical protein
MGISPFILMNDEGDVAHCGERPRGRGQRDGQIAGGPSARCARPLHGQLSTLTNNDYCRMAYSSINRNI